ncbi:GmrSD restriction endonuclease domain-containing protein [Herbaspirillum huttiense]|uniref:GmrSD restriction endonuclease domain-containing protein n=1 Tax=Herbaspirillum huttiense TaxID=863372 RepID=UPI001F0E297F|nr:DUF262 domain-containing protein [Herbaspirillum huttiense]
MNLKHAIVSVATTALLKKIIKKHDVEVTDWRMRELLEKTITSKKRFKSGDLLQELSEQEVKTVCESMRVDSKGRKQDLIARLESIDARPSTDALKTDLLSVGALFGTSESSYTIPVYQRNYAWRAEQIQQLIIDIQDALREAESSYFLGNLIVTERKDVNSFEVIDGQQRLTTLYLLLTFLSQKIRDSDATHRDRLKYESRPRATEALRRVSERHTQVESVNHEDAGIHEGFNVIQQFIGAHPELSHQKGLATFFTFLQHKVNVVRVSLPAETDLNRYFEIMNTRGKQLRQVDIIKARLMSVLDDEDRACFAWIWDACAEMDSYVQMSLTRNNPKSRDEIFGKDWKFLLLNDFEELRTIYEHARIASAGNFSLGDSLSVEGALQQYAQLNLYLDESDQENVRFRSTIEFSSFLLHVLKIFKGNDDEDEGGLDDKRLIKLFDEDLPSSSSKKSEWVRNFAITLLRCRNLFDGFILKRQYTATNDVDGDWSICSLIRRKSKDRFTPGYVSTLYKGKSNVEEDGNIDADTIDLLMLQSMLRVTYTSPRTMHWITRLLRCLHESDNVASLSGKILADELRTYARDKVREAFFAETEGQPEGFSINRIVFTYLDYLLLGNADKSVFRFTFRNSIEHFYPQHPDKEQSGQIVSPQFLNVLGNLALLSVSANSKFSNNIPDVKAKSFESFQEQSPKLKKMASITRKEGWGNDQVRRHHSEMLHLLADDLGLSQISGICQP